MHYKLKIEATNNAQDNKKKQAIIKKYEIFADVLMEKQKPVLKVGSIQHKKLMMII